MQRKHQQFAKYIVFILLIASSCISGKGVTHTGIEEISFGGGGGFTGEIKKYTLTHNGDLINNGENIKNISSRHTLELFTQAVELIDYSYNEPGNMYSFIQIKTNSKTNRIVWKFQAADLDQKVLSLYDSLMSITK